MRAIQKAEMLLGQIAIENIALDARCRDDVPAVLKGIQYIYCQEELRQEIFTLLENHILEKLDPAGDSPEAGRINRAVGRRGMDLWNILVLGLLKQGINCDYDRLHDLANRHLDVRRMLGLSEVFDNTAYSYRTLLRNVALLTPELLATEHASDHERAESVQPGTFVAATTRQAKAGAGLFAAGAGSFATCQGDAGAAGGSRCRRGCAGGNQVLSGTYGAAD